MVRRPVYCKHMAKLFIILYSYLYMNVMKRLNLLKLNLSKILPFFILFIIIVLLLKSDFLYFTAYTIDYLLNRSTYTFKEEGQFSDNKFEHNDSFLQNYMKNTRENKLKNMPLIEAVKLPEIDINNLNSKTVAQISENFTQPFVVRGLIKNFDCVKKWNLDYFEKHYGNIEMLSFSDNKSVSYSNGNATKLKNCKGNNNLCTMKEIVNGIRNGEPVYVNNISALFTQSEQAHSELNLDKMSDIMNSYMLKNSEENNPFMSQLFLGGKNTGTNLHCASNINFFFNIYGMKHWGFIDSKYTDLINSQTSDQGLFAISPDDYFSKDPNNPFLKIPRYETILTPGDFLFNPAWYWHAVKNKTDYTIAVANRFTGTYALNPFEEMPMMNNKFFTFLQLFSPFYYLQYYGIEKGKEQQGYGKIVDQEIINNLSQSQAI